MDPKLYIFDWSGTLSDDRLPAYRAVSKLLAKYGKSVSFDQWLAGTVKGVEEQFRTLGIEEDIHALYSQYAKLYNEVVSEGVVPTLYPETKETLQTLKTQGKTIIIISAHPEEALKREIETYGLDSLLDSVRGSSKNKVQDIRNVCSQMGIPPERAIYIGDTIQDIRWAKEAGVRSGAVTHGYHTEALLRREKPDMLLHDLLELLRIQRTPEGATHRTRETR